MREGGRREGEGRGEEKRGGKGGVKEEGGGRREEREEEEEEEGRERNMEGKDPVPSKHNSHLPSEGKI